MDEQVLLKNIVVSRDVLHGKPRIAGTRIEEIISEDYFPDITAEDVLTCLAYANKGSM